MCYVVRELQTFVLQVLHFDILHKLAVTTLYRQHSIHATRDASDADIHCTLIGSMHMMEYSYEYDYYCFPVSV
jgi:hypothetical protein